MNKLRIIVLNFNGGQDTVDCLASLAKVEEPEGFQVSTVVVDNHSTDNSLALVKKQFPRIKRLENEQNLGFAEGNNVGLHWALEEGADFCLVLNNDTLVKPDFLTQLVNCLKGEEQAGIVSPKIYFSPGCEFHRQRYSSEERGRVVWYAGGWIDWNNVLAGHRGVDQVDQGQFDQLEETDFATGCCMLIKRAVLERVGFFDPGYFLYWEDNDLCQRAKQRGFKVYYCPQSVIWHKNAGASGVGSGLHDYYLTRNRLLFGWRYAGLRAKLALFRESLVKLVKGRPWEKKAIRDFYLHRFGQGSYTNKIKED